MFRFCENKQLFVINKFQKTTRLVNVIEVNFIKFFITCDKMDPTMGRVGEEKATYLQRKSQDVGQKKKTKSRIIKVTLKKFLRR